MNELQKKFESTGYSSWINSEIYPDGRIYTKEYTEWLEGNIVSLKNNQCNHLWENVGKWGSQPMEKCDNCDLYREQP